MKWVFNRIFFRLVLSAAIFTSMVNNSDLVATGSATCLHGLAQIFKPEFLHLSPVWGAMLWHMGYCKKLFQFLPDIKECHGTRVLVHELFNYFEGDFNVTVHPLKAASYLTPKIIGEIINCIEVNRENQYFKEFLKKIINPKKLGFQPNTGRIQVFYDDIINRLNRDACGQREEIELLQASAGVLRVQRQIQELTTKLEKINEDIKINEIILKEEKKQRFIFELSCQALINAIADAVREEFVDAKEVCQRHIDQAQTKKTDLKAKLSGMPINKRQAISDAIAKIDSGIEVHKKKLIAVGSEKSSALFYKHHTLHLFLAVLWTNINSKEDLFPFLEIMSGQLVDPGIGLPIFQKDFTAEDYDSIFIQAPEKIDVLFDLSSAHLEELAFLYVGYDLFKNKLPNEIKMKSDVRYKTASFSDCGEISLLKLVNALIFDSEKRIFDVSLLKKINANEKLIKFYLDYSTAKSMKDNMELHQAWAEVVSGIKNVIYSNSIGCDIKPGLNGMGIYNMLRVLSYLFNNEFKTLKDFCEFIEINFNKVISLSQDDKEKEQIVTIELDRGISLAWHFYSEHFELDYPPKQVAFDKVSNYLLNYTQELLSGKFDPRIIFMTAFYPVVIHVNVELMDEFLLIGQDVSKDFKMYLRSASLAFGHFFLFGHQENTSEIGVEVIPHILLPNIYKFKYVSNVHELIPSDLHTLGVFWNSIPVDILKGFISAQIDEKSRYVLACSVLRRKIEGLCDWAFKTIVAAKLPEGMFKQEQINLIILKFIKSNDDWAFKILESMDKNVIDDYLKTKIIECIFCNEFDCRYDWALQALNSLNLKDLVDQYKIKFIQFIINHKLTGGYDFVLHALNGLNLRNYQKKEFIKFVIDSQLEELYGWALQTLNGFNLEYLDYDQKKEFILLIIDRKCGCGYDWVVRALNSIDTISVDEKELIYLIGIISGKKFELGYDWVKKIEAHVCE